MRWPLFPRRTKLGRGSRLVNRALIQELGRRCPDQRIATVGQDATIIESSKHLALRTYEGGRGCQPMLAVARKAFAALPEAVKTYYYRGDSACHENRLIQWLRDEKRAGVPAGLHWIRDQREDERCLA